MKNFNLLPIFLALVLFISCEKESPVEEQIEASEPTNISDHSLTAHEYGSYHNEILGLYMSHKKKEGSKIAFRENHDFVALLNDIAKVTKEEAPELFNQADYELTMNRINQVFTKEKSTLKRTDYFSTLEVGINKFSPGKTQTLFSEIMNGELDYDIILNKLNDFVATNELTAEELNATEGFKSVFTSSQEYWTPKNEKGVAQKPDPMVTQVLVADGIGYIFGGIGSVGFSLAIHILQDGHPL